MTSGTATLRAGRAWLAGVWAGGLWTIALVAAPAAFAVLARGDAGRMVGRLFAVEAAASLAISVLLLLSARRVRRLGESAMNADTMLVLVALFCTVAGHYALQPLFEQARAGQGRWSFGALHGASTVLYAIKALAVSALAWRLVRGQVPTPPTS